MTIADRISNKRIELGYSQEDLAKKCGWTNRSSISQIEGAGDKISLKKIKKVAKALDVSAEYLMGWEDEHSMLVRSVNSIQQDVVTGEEITEKYTSIKKDINKYIHAKNGEWISANKELLEQLSAFDLLEKALSADTSTLNTDEKNIINAYRAADDLTQAMVRRTLGIE